MLVSAYIAAALGNPGPEYARTRHNVGFMLADLAAASFPSGRWRPWKDLGAYFDMELGGKRVFLLKPETYMNNSGLAVRGLADFYKVPASGVIAVYDEMALPLGAVRVRRGGSSGGHKGMQSVSLAMGTEEIARIRIGVGPRPERIQARDFVLGRFSGEEEKKLAPALLRGVEALTTALRFGLDEAMNRYNYDKSVS